MRLQKDNLFLILLVAAVLIVGIVTLLLSQNQLPGQLSKPDSQTKNLSAQSSSDEAPSLEKDALNTDLSGIDQELEQIEAELSRP